MADVHLVIQKTNASDLVMPSKLTAILSVGGLAVITAPQLSTLHEVVTKHEIGILAEPENQFALLAGIKTALEQQDKRIKNNARAYAENFLSINQILCKYEDDINLA